MKTDFPLPVIPRGFGVLAGEHTVRVFDPPCAGQEWRSSGRVKRPL
jgi:hypothetical protein